MKLSLVTSQVARCGLAEMSRDFVASIRDKANIEVITYDECGCFPRYKDADVILMLHHPFYCPAGRTIRWLTSVKAYAPEAKLFVHITDLSRETFKWADYTKFLDGVILYGEHLINDTAYVPDKTFLIPHGITVCDEVAKEKARQQLGIDGQPIISYFGFPNFHKRLHIIVLAARIVQHTYPTTLLLMLCSPWFSGETTLPPQVFLEDLIKASGVNGSILTNKWNLDEYLPYIQASDIYVSHQNIWNVPTQSGSCFRGIMARRPTIINDTLMFAQMRPYSMQIRQSTPKVLAQAILYIYENESVRTELENRARSAYEKYNWNVVGQQYLDLFQHSLNGDDLSRFAYQPKGELDVQPLWKSKN